MSSLFIRADCIILITIYDQRNVPPVTCPQCYCWAQSVDRRYPWICLRNLWIHTLRRNPWIAQISVDRAMRSMNFAYDTILLAQTYMDGLVISTNLKVNNFTHFNGPLQSTEQNHRPSASERLHRSRQALNFKAGTCRNITIITHFRFAPD